METNIHSASQTFAYLNEQQSRISNAAMSTAGTNTRNLFGLSVFGFGLPAVFHTSGQKQALEAKKQYDEVLPALDKISKAIEKALDTMYSSEGVQGPSGVIEQVKQVANSTVSAKASTAEIKDLDQNKSMFRA